MCRDCDISVAEPMEFRNRFAAAAPRRPARAAGPPRRRSRAVTRAPHPGRHRPGRSARAHPGTARRLGPRGLTRVRHAAPGRGLARCARLAGRASRRCARADGSGRGPGLYGRGLGVRGERTSEATPRGERPRPEEETPEAEEGTPGAERARPRSGTGGRDAHPVQHATGNAAGASAVSHGAESEGGTVIPCNTPPARPPARAPCPMERHRRTGRPSRVARQRQRIS